MERVYGDPEVMRHVAHGDTWDRWRTAAVLAAHAQHHRVRGLAFWAVVERRSGTVIGDAGLEPIDGRPGTAEVGWTLQRGAWGRGYATEAGAAVVRAAFGPLGLVAVEALILPANTASVRVALKLGLRPVGHRIAYERLHRVLRLAAGHQSPVMDVVVAGAHGKVARLLHPLLVARGDRVRGIIRNPDHAPDLEALGVAPVVCDLEHASDEELQEAVRGADAFVFAAGAGPGSGPERKFTMDRDGAIRALRACEATRVPRYVMVSAMGTDEPPEGDDVFSIYLRAKAEADRALMDSGLEWTIVRPGGLTDDEPTGRVHAARHVPRGEIPRGDVAGVLAAVLAEPRTAGVVFEVVSGETPIEEAVAALTGA